jgi:hypothetical protein
MMVDRIILYISAAADLEVERSILSRAVTEIPVTLAWRIVHSPLRGEPADLEAVSKADFHILLMGIDIRAPIGLEWFYARRAGRSPVLFLKQRVLRTPAAQEFVRTVEDQANWIPYQDPADLRHAVLLLLGDHLHRNALHYALRPDEHESLEAWREALKQETAEQVDESRGGTGESSVILSTERYVPSEGVLIRPKTAREDPEEGSMDG